MQKLKHSDGPWFLGPILRELEKPGPLDGTRCVQANWDAEQQDIAYVHPSADGGDVAGCEERDGNARIIAAADSMYSYIFARAELGDKSAVEMIEAIAAMEVQ